MSGTARVFSDEAAAILYSLLINLGYSVQIEATEVAWIFDWTQKQAMSARA